MTWWQSEGRSLSGYLRKLAYIKEYRRQHPDMNKKACSKMHAKQKELYGGRPDSNTRARANWILSKEANNGKGDREG